MKYLVIFVLISKWFMINAESLDQGISFLSIKSDDNRNATDIDRPVETVAAQEPEVIAITQNCLKQHNIYRSSHDAPALVSDSKCEQYALKRARKMADTDDFSHNPGDYGENLYMYFSTGNTKLGDEDFGKQATDSWYKEIDSYDFNNPGFSSKTGHFTQLVWKGTNRIGCAVSRSQKSSKIYVIAIYSPAGNLQGAFPENVKPKH